jgi:cytochrome P450
LLDLARQKAALAYKLHRSTSTHQRSESHVIAIPDISNPITFDTGFPHDVFNELRREAPVYWHEGDYTGGRGFWIVSKYDDIKSISRQPKLFASSQGTGIEDREREEGFQSMISMDPPSHLRYRKLVAGGFTPRQIAEQEPHHREIVKSILGSVLPKGECDFVVDIASELPLRVIAELVGFPQEHCDDMFEWTNIMIGNQDPEFAPTPADAQAAAMKMFQLAHTFVEDRLANPTDDLMSKILHGEVDGHRITPIEFDAFFLLLTVAGNETTRNLISHGMLQLIEHPEALETLHKHPEKIPNAIEEMLRFKPPVITFRRTATEDTELRGQKIRKDDKLMMYYPSANRDEDVYENPHTFDIERKNNHHLAFGVGEHFCIGTHLARLEARVMFEGILESMRDIEVTGPVSYLRSNLIDGVKHIPIKFSATL